MRVCFRWALLKVCRGELYYWSVSEREDLSSSAGESRRHREAGFDEARAVSSSTLAGLRGKYILFCLGDAHNSRSRSPVSSSARCRGGCWVGMCVLDGWEKIPG